MPDALRKRAETRAELAGHASLAAYVEALIRADVCSGNGADAGVDTDSSGPAHLSPRRRADLEGMLVAGVDSGPAVEMTAADWAGIRREVADRIATARKSAPASKAGRTQGRKAGRGKVR
jgi:hypothetical protein